MTTRHNKRQQRWKCVWLFCRCALINSHVCTSIWVYVFLFCMHLGRASIACGAFYLILQRGNTVFPSLPLFPPALWTWAAAEDAVGESTACPERKLEDRKNSLLSWQLDATFPKILDSPERTVEKSIRHSFVKTQTTELTIVKYFCWANACYIWPDIWTMAAWRHTSKCCICRLQSVHIWWIKQQIPSFQPMINKKNGQLFIYLFFRPDNKYIYYTKECFSICSSQSFIPWFQQN